MSETILPVSVAMTSAAYSGAALEWLNARPEPPVRTDLCALNDSFAIQCIHELVDNRPFDLTIQANHPAGDWLNHLYFEARNREKVFGTKNLGIGYPFVLAHIGGEEVSAPLFIWQISLEPDQQHADHWHVQRGANHALLPNYPLFHLLDALHDTNLSQQAHHLVEAKSLNTKDFGEMIEGVRLMLGLIEDGLPLEEVLDIFSAAPGYCGGRRPARIR